MSKHTAINRFGRSGNPAFSQGFGINQSVTGEVMTLDGTVNKTGILLGLCVGGAYFGWNAPGLVLPAVLIGFVIALFTIFRPKNSPYTAPAYAAIEGVALGGITMIFEAQYPGIGIQAIGLTFGILASLLFCYKSGIIKPTENLRLMIVAGTMGIFILYSVSFIMSFFGNSIGFIHSNGLFGIGFSLFVVAIASLNLVLDFDFIEEGAEKGMPKYLEWYGAFSLMVTLVWLYLEILRLLAKLRSR
ncbi:MAG: Bax inhibitor-1/YccA family protein [Gammaproteobacteria bacterium]|jgi:uncharacterized YccA/Bax inhibitor family protein|nr:Bax inhibitor-1/YccA family protein [SAR86 cluster bacterium]|tara:strand:- start:321 stop:1055 length:735 start_codon:yes stop_codon:yes gene_type:complete